MTRRPGAPLWWRRMPMEAESPEEYGYERIRANLAESSCRDRKFGDLGIDLDELVLLYGDHRGNPDLRARLAAEAGVDASDVLLANGAAMALFLVAITLLGPTEHLVVVRPNYATNLETPFAIGCEVTYVDLTLEGGFQIDLAELAAAIRPNTRLISVTTPHNPTGVELSLDVLQQLLALAETQQCHLLVDETYRDMADTAIPVASSLSSRIISVSSVSKTYGIPGIREGWAICSDRALMHKMLAAKEQIVLTGSVLDEAIADSVHARRDVLLPPVREFIAAQRKVVEAWIAAEPRLEWVQPTGGVVCFPRIREDADIDTDAFYQHLLDNGIFVGPGHWFDQSPRHFRLGWGWPTPEELQYGLDGITAALTASKRA